MPDTNDPRERPAAPPPGGTDEAYGDGLDALAAHALPEDAPGAWIRRATAAKRAAMTTYTAEVRFPAPIPGAFVLEEIDVQADGPGTAEAAVLDRLARDYEPGGVIVALYESPHRLISLTEADR